jgi:DNA-binding response OmpR family regulator
MSRKKILVVEDDPDVRQGMHLRLEANDYEVSFAADVVSSVIAARKHEPDLIILDLGLPAGDGFLVIERLKVERAVAAGVKAFLQKPVDNDELLAVIRQILGGPAEPERPAFASKPNRSKVLL